MEYNDSNNTDTEDLDETIENDYDIVVITEDKKEDKESSDKSKLQDNEEEIQINTNTYSNEHIEKISEKTTTMIQKKKESPMHAFNFNIADNISPEDLAEMKKLAEQERLLEKEKEKAMKQYVEKKIKILKRSEENMSNNKQPELSAKDIMENDLFEFPLDAEELNSSSGTYDVNDDAFEDANHAIEDEKMEQIKINNTEPAKTILQTIKSETKNTFVPK